MKKSFCPVYRFGQKGLRAFILRPLEATKAKHCGSMTKIPLKRCNIYKGQSKQITAKAAEIGVATLAS